MGKLRLAGVRFKKACPRLLAEPLAAPPEAADPDAFEASGGEGSSSSEVGSSPGSSTFGSGNNWAAALRSSWKGLGGAAS
eukprot:9301500-Alexandrium_andersonii.AAC.1